MVAYVQRMFPIEIRGMLTSLRIVINSLMYLAIVIVATYFYEKNNAAPFALMGGLDTLTGVAVILFSFCGLIE